MQVLESLSTIAYNELMQRDFFGIKDRDLTNTFID